MLEIASHAAPGDAIPTVLEGEAEITISGEAHIVRTGEPHSLRAPTRFKMLLVLVKQ